MSVLRDGNYIKISRDILDWEWYGDINTCRLFFHLLLKANWKDGRFKGTTVPRGSLISSHPKLAEECGLTINEIRTALKHLISTGEITVNAHSKYSVITVNNYCLYQDINRQITDKPQTNDSQTTDKSQSINSLLTAIEEKKEEKEGKEKKDPKGSKETRFTPPTPENVMGYCREKGYCIDAERFVDFYASKNWMVGKNKMKDWQAAVRNWWRQEGGKRDGPTGCGPAADESVNGELARRGISVKFDGF